MLQRDRTNNNRPPTNLQQKFAVVCNCWISWHCVFGFCLSMCFHLMEILLDITWFLHKCPLTLVWVEKNNFKTWLLRTVIYLHWWRNNHDEKEICNRRLWICAVVPNNSLWCCGSQAPYLCSGIIASFSPTLYIFCVSISVFSINLYLRSMRNTSRLQSCSSSFLFYFFLFFIFVSKSQTFSLVFTKMTASLFFAEEHW